jgi:hypothetical protein
MMMMYQEEGGNIDHQVLHAPKKRKLLNGSTTIPVLYMEDTTTEVPLAINQDFYIEDVDGIKEKDENTSWEEPKRRIRFYAYCSLCQSIKGYFESGAKERDILQRMEARKTQVAPAPTNKKTIGNAQKEERKIFYSSLNYSESQNPEADPSSYGYQWGDFPQRKCDSCRSKITYRGRPNPYRHLATTGQLNRVVKYKFYSTTNGNGNPTSTFSSYQYKTPKKRKYQDRYRERVLGSNLMVPFHIQKIYNRKEMENRFPGLTDKMVSRIKPAPLYSVGELKTGVNIPADTKQDAISDTFKLFWNSPFCINEYCQNNALYYGYCSRCWGELKRN